ncbi:retrovirus-related pol polyprotein from transposon TNT 1-94, partial [Tanacetum coccineum]
MAAEVPQTLEYSGGQLNVAPMLEVENFTNWKKGFCATLLDFHDSPGDEEDTRSNQEYLNDLEEEFHERAMLGKSKRFFKKGSQRFSGEKATDETQCHICGRKGHFARDWPTKDFEAKYNKVKAKLALLSSGASTSKSSMVKNKGLVVEAYEWDKDDVSSDDNEM